MHNVIVAVGMDQGPNTRCIKRDLYSFTLTRITYLHVDSPSDDDVVRQLLVLPPESTQGAKQPVVEQDITVGEAIVSGARIPGNTLYVSGARISGNTLYVSGARIHGNTLYVSGARIPGTHYT